MGHLSALLTFRTHLDGFTNRDLRLLTRQLSGLNAATLTAGQTTYNLPSPLALPPASSPCDT